MKIDFLRNALQMEKPCPEARVIVSDIDLEIAGLPGGTHLDDAVIKAIRKGLEDHRPSEQIAAAVEFKKQIANLYELDRLRPLVAQLRNRYRIAVDRSAKATDDAGLPGVEDSTRDKLLGEADSLLERLKIIYTLSSLRDSQVAQFRRGALWIMTALLLLLIATKAPAALGYNVPIGVNQTLNLCTIALFGAVGSMASIMRRSQNALDLGPIDIDPVRQISALRHGFSGMLIAALVGPVLALVLFAVFAAGMVEIAGLTPQFAKSCRDCSFSFLDHQLHFETAVEASKMAIWAFLAGFAEQLVPDVLDKFTKAADEAPASKSP